MEFYIYLNGEKRGPFDEARVQRLLDDALLRPTDLAAIRSDGEFRPLASFARFSSMPASSIEETQAIAPPVELKPATVVPGIDLPRVPAEALGPYSRSTLGPNETAYLRTSLHWIIFARFAGFGLILFFFVALPFAVVVQALTGSEIGWFALPLPIFVMVPPAVAYASSELVVTNLRVLIKTGIIRRQTLEMFISKIESVAVDQGFFGRLLDYGTVMIRGTGGFQEPFETIAHPLQLRNIVQRLQSVHPPSSTT